MATQAEAAAATRAHREAQKRLGLDVAARVRVAWPLLDPADVNASVDRWLGVVLPLVLDGRRESASLAAAYLRAFARLEADTDARVLLAEVDDQVREAAATSLRVTGPVQVTAMSAAGYSREQASQSALSATLGAAMRHAMDGGRETLVRSIEVDPRLVGWRRVGDGSSCKFCRMLIGRGEVYSAETARFAAHDNCGCSAEPAYGGESASVVQYAASARKQTDRDRARVREYLARMDG